MASSISEEQINGWLGSDLPEKFPDLMVEEIENPRVALGVSEIKLAFRVRTSRFKGYVVASGDAFCTDEENQVAVRISDIRAGITPIPIAIWADRITDAMRVAGLPAEWTEMDGDPVVLIALPDDLATSEGKEVIVDSIQIDNGTLTLQGRTVAMEPKE